MLHHKMRKTLSCENDRSQSREKRKQPVSLSGKSETRFSSRTHPCRSAEDCVRLKPRHEISTQRQQVEPQMGNHDSDSLTKHLNSFLPVMYISMMTETVRRMFMD